MAELRILVGEAAFDTGAEFARLIAAAGEGAGGIGCFVGVVRGGDIAAIVLEHYPPMTERHLATLAAEAAARFDLAACTVIHRVGRLVKGEPIVLVLAAAAHRASALDATRFLIDRLKTEAPFWKREERRDGSVAWVSARATDSQAAAAWTAPPRPSVTTPR